MFATATLAFSILGLTFLIGFKWWEDKTGRMILPQTRARVGEKIHASVSVAREKVPTLLARIGTAWFEIVREVFKRVFARALLLSEEALEGTLKHLRRTERKHRGGEASSFLREVAEHKKQLRDREIAE
jgi:hypothetical protein